MRGSTRIKLVHSRVQGGAGPSPGCLREFARVDCPLKLLHAMLWRVLARPGSSSAGAGLACLQFSFVVWLLCSWVLARPAAGSLLPLILLTSMPCDPCLRFITSR